MKVLLADDDMAGAGAVKKLLEAKAPNVKVVLATSLTGALEMATKENPSVVVLDAAFPDSDAFQTMDAIPKFAPATVVVMSGYEEEALVLKAFEKGATDFLVKDSQTNVVQRIIYAHLRKLNARST